MDHYKLAYIGLGANLGERQDSLQRALDMLAHTGAVKEVRVSRVYESPSWGFKSAHLFMNAVVELHWASTPIALLEQCYRIEAALGRHQHAERPVGEGTQPYSDRVIDLDLLWFEDVTCTNAQLVLPHPRAHQRAFVLIPWLELTQSLKLDGRKLVDWLAAINDDEIEAVKPCLGVNLVVPELGQF